MKKLLAISILVASSAGAQDLATSFKSTEVAPGIHMVEGVGGFGGGNIGLLVGDDYIAMIDDSMPPLAPTLLSFVNDLAGGGIDFLVNTHVHGDHAGGNAHFANSGTVIFAHENIRRRLKQDPSIAGGEAGLPVITFGDGVTFHLNGLEARVLHLPTSHTDGDAIIWFPDANVIHTGDIWFHDLFPFIDLDNGGDVAGYIKSQKRILELANDETRIIPGHGPLGNKEQLQNNLNMLIDAAERIQQRLDAGDSEEDILKANPLASYHEQYNWGFITTERMTRTLIRSLTSE